MDFKLSEEEQLLEDTVRDFVAREYAFEKRRAILRSAEGFSREVWRQFAELGLLGIGVPEQDGGLDAGPVPMMLVMNAIGAALVLEPFLASAVVATTLLSSAGDDEHARDLLPAMAEGRAIVALAHREPAARYDLAHVGTRARRHAGGFTLDGRKSVVTHAPAADTLIVSARVAGGGADTDGLSLFRVPVDAGGLVLESYTNVDGQRAADIELRGVELPANARIGPEGAAQTALERAHDVGLAAVCAEAVGAMQVLLDTTAEYLRTRRQFGQPIGRFQALQHRAADMLIHCEQARSMSYLAALRCLEPDRRERRRALSAAKVVIGRACRFVGQQAVQLHGGMGMTDELSVSHYFKRLTAIELEFGDAEHHLDRFIGTSSD
jgi:alkylation response protein AidB-like acyl-CoA dehydrogenase